jgi:hypothetical protein
VDPPPSPPSDEPAELPLLPAIPPPLPPLLPPLLGVPAEVINPPEPAPLPPTLVPAELVVPADGCVAVPAPPALCASGAFAEQPSNAPTQRAAKLVCSLDMILITKFGQGFSPLRQGRAIG